MMDIKFEDETPWLFEIGTFLTDRNITYTDITEIIMLVKSAPTDLDASALVTKKLSTAEIAWLNSDSLSVTIASTDYGSGKMEIGGTYFVYIGFTNPGYGSPYLEARLKNNQITITQDGIRS